MAVRSPGEKDSSFPTECHDTLSNSLQTTVHKQGSTKKTHPGLQGEKATRMHQLPKSPINKSRSVTPPSLGQTAGLLPVRCHLLPEAGFAPKGPRSPCYQGQQPISPASPVGRP